MQKLSSTNFPVGVAYRIKKIVDSLNKIKKAIETEYLRDIRDVYGKRDEKGEVVMGPQGQGFEIADGKDEEFSKAQEAFGDRLATVERPRLTFGDLGNTQLTPGDLTALECVFEADDEAAKTAPNIVNMRK